MRESIRSTYYRHYAFDISPRTQKRGKEAAWIPKVDPTINHLHHCTSYVPMHRDNGRGGDVHSTLVGTSTYIPKGNSDSDHGAKIGIATTLAGGE